MHIRLDPNRPIFERQGARGIPKAQPGAADKYMSPYMQQVVDANKREAQRQGRSLTFIQHSPAVREVLDLLNLVAELGDPMVIPLDARGGRP